MTLLTHGKLITRRGTPRFATFGRHCDFHHGCTNLPPMHCLFGALARARAREEGADDYTKKRAGSSQLPGTNDSFSIRQGGLSSAGLRETADEAGHEVGSSRNGGRCPRSSRDRNLGRSKPSNRSALGSCTVARAVLRRAKHGTIYEHFDIAMSKRKLAVAAGAREVTRRELGRIMLSRREERS